MWAILLVIIFDEIERSFIYVSKIMLINHFNTRMWANAQRDGRPAEHRWRPLFNGAKFG